jgi:hypothetical protein
LGAITGTGATIGEIETFIGGSGSVLSGCCTVSFFSTGLGSSFALGGVSGGEAAVSVFITVSA